MATFNVGIGKEDIQEGVLLPEDWYTVQITREPYEDKNAAWKEAGDKLSIEEAGRINQKAGKNIVINLKVISDVPEFSGRNFTKWLSLPSVLDEGLYMNDGQPKADWKASKIFKWVEAFGGAAEGAEASLATGAKGLVYVVQGKDRDGETDVNEISMNVDPRSLTGGAFSGGADPFDGGLL